MGTWENHGMVSLIMVDGHCLWSGFSKNKLLVYTNSVKQNPGSKQLGRRSTSTEKQCTYPPAIKRGNWKSSNQMDVLLGKSPWNRGIPSTPCLITEGTKPIYLSMSFGTMIPKSVCHDRGVNGNRAPKKNHQIHDISLCENRTWARPIFLRYVAILRKIGRHPLIRWNPAPVHRWFIPL